MKKILLMALSASLMVACNDAADSTTTESDTTATMTTMDNTTSYSPAEGDVTYRENRVQVWRGGVWVDADDDVELDNGLVVRRNGRVVRNGEEIEMEDGVVIDRSGNVFDKTGRALDNAWEHTKDGAKKVGSAVGNAAEEVGDKVKNAVDDDDDGKNKGDIR